MMIQNLEVPTEEIVNKIKLLLMKLETSVTWWFGPQQNFEYKIKTEGETLARRILCLCPKIDFFFKIVIGDETWAHHWDFPTK